MFLTIILICTANRGNSLTEAVVSSSCVCLCFEYEIDRLICMYGALKYNQVILTTTNNKAIFNF